MSNVKFFQPEDFYVFGQLDTLCTPMEAAEIGNAKLEREGRVVFGVSENSMFWTGLSDNDTHKGLLVNIQPIEKCSHPVDKVNRKEHYYQHGLITGPKETTHFGTNYECSLCGKIVKPGGFEE
jgi:hypothetical protein